MGSWGATLDFYLSENQDAAAAKQFCCQVLAAVNHPRPRVINADGNHPPIRICWTGAGLRL